MSLYESLTRVLAPFASRLNGLLTGYDGTVYSTPAEAVRMQISDLHVLIGDIDGDAKISGSAVSYDGTESDLTATTMQGAVDEVCENVSELNGRLDQQADALGMTNLPWDKTAPTVNNYSAAGGGTLDGYTLTVPSGATVAGTTRVGCSVLFNNAEFVGKKLILKPHFTITGDTSAFVFVSTKQEGNDGVYTVEDDSITAPVIVCDLTNATANGLSTKYYYFYVQGKGTTVGQDTVITYTGYDLLYYDEQSEVIGTIQSDIATIGESVAELEEVKSGILPLIPQNPITSIFSRVNDLKNGATSSDGIITIPSGSTGNQTYLGVRTFTMSQIRGCTLNFTIRYSVTDTIASKLNPIVLANGTGVTTKNLNLSDNTVTAEIVVPSDTTATYVLVALKLVNSSALASDATITMTDYSVTVPGTLEEGIENTINENLSNNENLSALVDIRQSSLTTFFSKVSATNHGSTVEGSTLTVPSGQTGNQDYIGIRVLGDIDKVKGRTFDVTVPYTVSSNLVGKTAIILQANGTGTTFNSSSWDGETVKANITVSDDATSTYVVIGVKVVTSTAFAEDATLTMGEYSVTETVSLQNGIANLLGSGRFYGKKMSCFGDSYTSQQGWQDTTVRILGLDSYSNVAIYGGVLTTGYAGIQNVDLDSDILTILYGTNDYSNNMALGTIEDDATSPTTFYGALKYVFEWASTNLPKCLIVPMTHTQRWASAKDLEFIANNGYGTGGQPKNNLGYSLLDYANAIIDVAERYGYRVLDFNRWGQVNKNNEGSFYGADHLHPSATSYILMGTKIAKFIQQE